MPLFQPKIIDKALARQKIEIIPAGHLQILDEWKLSLWLKTAQRGKPLTALDANLVSGNSLGVSQAAPCMEAQVSGEAGSRERPPESSFCWQTAFLQIMQQGDFDVALGNPPYVRPMSARSVSAISSRGLKHIIRSTTAQPTPTPTSPNCDTNC